MIGRAKAADGHPPIPYEDLHQFPTAEALGAVMAARAKLWSLLNLDNPWGTGKENDPCSTDS